MMVTELAEVQILKSSNPQMMVADLGSPDIVEGPRYKSFESLNPHVISFKSALPHILFFI
jgi:hypothetical protein